jgi:hypothetical protein
MLAEAKLASFLIMRWRRADIFSRELPVEFSHCIPLGRAVLACPVANRGCLAGSLRAQKSVAEIFEVGSDTEVAALYKLDHRLQIVFLFSGDANLSILQLALHFESL